MIFTIYELARVNLVIASIVLCLKDHAAVIAAMPELHEADFLLAIYPILEVMWSDLKGLVKILPVDGSHLLRYMDKFIAVQLSYYYRDACAIIDSTVTQTKSKDIARCTISAANCIEMGTKYPVEQLEFENERLKRKCRKRLAMAHHWHYSETDTVQDPSKKCWLGSLSKESLLTIVRYLQ
jgi:hypothetical protein